MLQVRIPDSVRNINQSIAIHFGNVPISLDVLYWDGPSGDIITGVIRGEGVYKLLHVKVPDELKNLSVQQCGDELFKHIEEEVLIFVASILEEDEEDEDVP